VSRHQPFLNIRTEGALLPSDLLSRLMEAQTCPASARGLSLRRGGETQRSHQPILDAPSVALVRLSKGASGAAVHRSRHHPHRERWLLQLFQELGYGRLIVASPVEIDGKTYPISHVWPGQYYQVPIHLVSFRADLDKRSEQRIQGASKASPHGWFRSI